MSQIEDAQSWLKQKGIETERKQDKLYINKPVARDANTWIEFALPDRDAFPTVMDLTRTMGRTTASTQPTNWIRNRNMELKGALDRVLHAVGWTSTGYRTGK